MPAPPFMMPNKTDRHDAAGLAQIVRTGWYKEVRIKSHGAYVVRALLSARDVLVGIRGKIENEIRGLLKTFGVMFGKKVGGFARRAEEIVSGELAAAPEIKRIVEALLEARRSILDRIKVLDAGSAPSRKQTPSARLFMTAPGVGAVIALSVASAYDDRARFRRSSSAGAYLGLTPRRYDPAKLVETAASRNEEQADPNPPVTKPRTCILTRGKVLLAEGLGAADCKDSRVQEGEGCRGAQTRRHPPRHVEARHAIPLECRRYLIPSAPDTRVFTDASLPGRLARMRPLPGLRRQCEPRTPLRPILPSNANMRRPVAVDHGENLEPGECYLTEDVR